LIEHRERYRNFCRSQKDVPLFNDPDWWDRVAPDRWNAAICLGSDGRILGAFPYTMESKFGLKLIRQPPLTSHTHILLNPYSNMTKGVKLHSFRRRVLTELIRQIPSSIYIKLVVSHEVENYLPFFWAGYNLSPRYSYLYYLNDVEEDIDRSFKKVVRKNIRNGLNKYKIVQDCDSVRFWKFYRDSYQRKDLDLIPEEYFYRIFDYLKMNDRILTLAALDENGNWVAAMMVGMDVKMAYSLIACEKAHVFRSPMSLLIMQALKYLQDKVQVFNFDGSMVKDIENFISSFTADYCQMMQVTRSNNVLSSFLLNGLGKFR
jgi:hypothetical protein